MLIFGIYQCIDKCRHAERERDRDIHPVEVELPSAGPFLCLHQCLSVNLRAIGLRQSQLDYIRKRPLLQMVTIQREELLKLHSHFTILRKYTTLSFIKENRYRGVAMDQIISDFNNTFIYIMLYNEPFLLLAFVVKQHKDKQKKWLWYSLKLKKKKKNKRKKKVNYKLNNII